MTDLPNIMPKRASLGDEKQDVLGRVFLGMHEDFVGELIHEHMARMIHPAQTQISAALQSGNYHAKIFALLMVMHALPDVETTIYRRCPRAHAEVMRELLRHTFENYVNDPGKRPSELPDLVVEICSEYVAC
jgi:hypothetical protein